MEVAPAATELLQKAQKIAAKFDFGPEQANTAVAHLVQHLDSALRNESTTQIPSFITSLPTGTETGVFLGVDLGGTNCRVCSVQLHGDSTYTLLQQAREIPRSVMTEHSYMPLFLFIAQCIADFLAANAHLTSPDTAGSQTSPQRLPLGFIFSFTFEQHSLARGVLLQWDKGWAIPMAIGRDPCQMLQEAVDTLELPVSVCALANDSVGTLLARAYTHPTNPPTLMGAIFGTGTNAAYAERLSRIQKLGFKADAVPSTGQDLMLMNTEWGGCFDDNTAALSSTQYDQVLDRESTNPAQQTLEKRTSGLYLGELLRLALVDLLKAELFRFTIKDSTTCPLLKRYQLDSELLSVFAGDSSLDLAESIKVAADRLQVSGLTLQDAQAIRTIAMAIGRRAGRISGVAVAGIIIQSGRVSKSRAGTMPLKATETQPPKSLARKTRDPRENDATGCTAIFKSLYQFLRRICGSTSPPAPTHPCSQEAKAAPKLNAMPQTSSPTLSSTTTAVFSTDSESETDVGVIDIGVDGSLIEYYPSFEEHLRSALRDIADVGVAGEQRVKIGLAKNGSSIGAAIAALYQSRELGEEI
ncbi:hypothetical protein BROUX41_001091 [Berkeleyomyces rouxiae]|uniref:uncharacterized protein n=1 Tax=Berkeleyomyces rouxiae TaxID=2035830 RepID=UPI003B796D9F